MSEVLDEPVISDANLKQDWHAAVKEAEGSDSLILEKFLREYVAPNWCTFEVTTSGIACGPFSTTALFVLDLNLQDADK